MSITVLKASVGDYSVNRSGRGVTVNQKYLGEPGGWGEVEPVHLWYLEHPGATVAEVAEQLDKPPKELRVHGYAVRPHTHGGVVVDSPSYQGAMPGEGRPHPHDDEVIQYLRAKMNTRTSIAECARLIEEYFKTEEKFVRGVRVYRMGTGQTGTSGARLIAGCHEYLCSLGYQSKPVAEVAKLIEEYQEPLTVKGCTVAMSANGTTVTGAGYSLSRYLSDHNYAGKSVAEVAKLIEAFVEPIKITVESGNEKHTFHTANDAMGYLQSGLGDDTVKLFVDSWEDGWFYLGFWGFGIVFNRDAEVSKSVKSLEEAKRFIRDQEVPF